MGYIGRFLLLLSVSTNFKEILCGISCFQCSEIEASGTKKCPIQGVTDIQTVLSDTNRYYSVRENNWVCSLGYSKDTGIVYAQVRTPTHAQSLLIEVRGRVRTFAYPAVHKTT